MHIYIYVCFIHIAFCLSNYHSCSFNICWFIWMFSLLSELPSFKTKECISYMYLSQSTTTVWVIVTNTIIVKPDVNTHTVPHHSWVLLLNQLTVLVNSYLQICILWLCFIELGMGPSPGRLGRVWKKNCQVDVRPSRTVSCG